MLWTSRAMCLSSRSNCGSQTYGSQSWGSFSRVLSFYFFLCYISIFSNGDLIFYGCRCLFSFFYHFLFAMNILTKLGGNRCPLRNRSDGRVPRLTVLATCLLQETSLAGVSLQCPNTKHGYCPLVILKPGLRLCGLDRAHTVSMFSDACVAPMALSQHFKNCAPFNWSEPTRS